MTGEEIQRKTMQYVDKFNLFQSDETVFSIRKELKNLYIVKNTLTEFEAISLWNLTPRDYDEAISLIPSLRDK
eukprot:CAMPEP_0170552898 /NCGR_PEP_ID=MMETSP0211-20121228/10790_1 /TAXON_ID=311385 /ORGANISM="Pseudokeronopsis sp., Strain OXSARD2" /LENGTH=72 /DNA_ID=CAMNT_0010860945 /DNA_START=10 /DNA_END=225 /DNA_ORIENTATION=-